MPSFAERLGHRDTRSLVQRDELDEETRGEFWNVLYLLPTMLRKISNGSIVETNVLDAIWTWEFKGLRDERPRNQDIWAQMKAVLLTAPWFDALDLLEATVKYLERYKNHYSKDLSTVIVDAFNNRFEHYLVGYRFIGHEITPIDSAADAEAVNSALDETGSINGARHHLERATELLADRQTPDYPNSIKESISAVEAVVKKVTGEGTLGTGLNKLEASGLTIHPALKGAWSKMYGWSSDENGIRHGSIEAADADQALAKYVLVTCSAFVSYLIEAARKAGLL